MSSRTDNCTRSSPLWSSLLSICDLSDDFSSLTGSDGDTSTVSALRVEPLLGDDNDDNGDLARNNTAVRIPWVHEVSLILGDARGGGLLDDVRQRTQRAPRKRCSWRHAIAIALVLLLGGGLLLIIFARNGAKENNNLDNGRMDKIVSYLNLVTLQQDTTNDHHHSNKRHHEPLISSTNRVVQRLVRDTELMLPQDAQDIVQYYALETLRETATPNETTNDGDPFVVYDTEGRVSQLYATAASPDIVLPPDMALLRHVRILRLRGWGAGTIPTELGLLSQLEFLDVAENDWTPGPVPSEWGKLRNLHGLSLSFNKGMTGVLPSSFCDLHRLEVLNMTGNHQLTVPYCESKDLEELVVDKNLVATAGIATTA